MNNLYVGIDPGKKGGIALLSRRGKFVHGFHIPLIGKEIDVRTIVFEFDKHGIEFCYIEQVAHPPAQNIKGTCTTCTGYGRILSVLDIMNIPFQEIHANKWKREFSLIKKTKNDSIAKARKLFPTAPENLFVGPRDGKLDGVAEALLIAEYCRRVTGG